MDVSTSLSIPPEVQRALMPLLNSEAAKALKQIGNKLIVREKLFLRHLEEGQSKWKPGSPAYEERKRRRGIDEKFVYSGLAKRALAGGSPHLFMRTNAKTRRLTIGLRKMENGVNIYAVAQRGRFTGATLSSKFGRKLTFTKAEIFDLNRLRSSLKRNGAKARQQLRTREPKFRQALRMLESSQREWTRHGESPRPVTVPLPEDEPIVTKVVMEELNITLACRGA